MLLTTVIIFLSYDYALRVMSGGDASALKATFRVPSWRHALRVWARPFGKFRQFTEETCLRLVDNAKVMDIIRLSNRQL